MTIPLFDYVSSINNKTILDDKDFKEYSCFVVNRALAQHKSTILIAQELNLMSELVPNMHYEYAFNAVPKGKRYGKWAKKDEFTEDEINISKYYQVNLLVARDYIKVMSKEQINNISKEYNNDHGSTKKSNKQK